LANAIRATTNELDKIVQNPANCDWYQNKNPRPINNKRDIQKVLSNVLEDIYYQTPIIKNELINRNNPSAQANAGRKKLLTALLTNAHKQDLGIEAYPAEKSMYKAILKNSGIHKKVKNIWKITEPKDKYYSKVWNKNTISIN
jgi:predicted amino acid dehydrogenase